MSGRSARARVGTALVCALLTSLAMASCSSGADPAPEPSTPVAVNPSTVGLEMVDRHPNGSVLTVRGIERRRASIAVDISVIDGFTDPIQLRSSSLLGRRSLFLVDDVGTVYRYDGQGDNPNLQVGPGEELTGSVVFLGSPDGRATSVTLKTNVGNGDDQVDIASRAADTTTPAFVIQDIPLPGAPAS